MALATMSGESTLNISAFAIPIIVAFLGTLIILGRETQLESRALQSSQAEQEKSKRQANEKLAMLMELMDEDERQAFKARLERQVLAEIGTAGDGELPHGSETLESLMQEDEAEQHMRR